MYVSLMDENVRRMERARLFAEKKWPQEEDEEYLDEEEEDEEDFDEDEDEDEE